MSVKYKIFFLVMTIGLLICPAANAQRLAAPSSSPMAQTTKANPVQRRNQPQKQATDEPDIWMPTQKNFDYKQPDMIEPKDEPQVFHFKIVNDKVSVVDPDKRNILVYYDDYKIIRGFDKITKCSIRVYVINDLQEKINTIGFKLHWPDVSTGVEMSQVKPGIKTYTDLLLLGDGCLRLDKTPTIEVNRCRVKGMSQEACADAVKWMPL